MPIVVDHDDRRRQIAAAACRVIATRGVDGARLSDIAREAGATTGLLQHYFATKDDLLLAAMESAVESMMARRTDSTEHDDVRGQLVEGLPLNDQCRVEMRVWLSFWGRIVANQALAERNAAFYEHVLERLRTAIEAARRAGRLRPDLDAALETDMLTAVVDGIAIRAALDADAWPAERQLLMLDHYLQGLLPRYT